jgi:hypothetical protein
MQQSRVAFIEASVLGKAAAFKASSSLLFLEVSCLHQLLLDHDSIQELGKK